MIYQTRAIVLRTVRYGETSLIADMYTEKKGHQTFIINSVRKEKALTPPSYLQLFTLLEIVAYHHEHRNMHRVREVRLDHTWQSIPFDMRKSSVITCLAEICSKCITTADPHPELFSFLHDVLIIYDNPKQYDRDFLIRFLVTLSHHLGFGMEVQSQQVEGKYFDLLEGHIVMERPVHQYLMTMEDFDHLRTILQAGPNHQSEVTHEVRGRLIDLIILYFQLHVESLREVNSLKILRALH